MQLLGVYNWRQIKLILYPQHHQHLVPVRSPEATDPGVEGWSQVGMMFSGLEMTAGTPIRAPAITRISPLDNSDKVVSVTPASAVEMWMCHENDGPIFGRRGLLMRRCRPMPGWK